MKELFRAFITTTGKWNVPKLHAHPVKIGAALRPLFVLAWNESSDWVA